MNSFESNKDVQRKVRAIAFYLPQFHPIPENDQWWGKGFTEWTNVSKARPLFRGHYQPRVPADLGFYDLRLPETRAHQAKLAREAGIEGFCYWHYWFAGKRLLEGPFNEVLASGEPDFPFCLAWANQSWSGIWHGAPHHVLMEQTYPGPQDHERHFYELLPAFHDPRYIRVHGKPLFVIYRPTEFPQLADFINQWQELAQKNGLKGIHFTAHLIPQDGDFDYKANGLSACTCVAALKVSSFSIKKLIRKLRQDRVGANSSSFSEQMRTLARLSYYALHKARSKFPGCGRSIYYYEDAMRFFLDDVREGDDSYPCLVPNWDNSPRSGLRAVILHHSTPELFREHARAAIQLVAHREFEDRIVFIKSWNEWAEGNYLEPDQKFGRRYLDVLREETCSDGQTFDANRRIAESKHLCV